MLKGSLNATAQVTGLLSAPDLKAEARLAEARPACCDFALHASATAWRESTAEELAFLEQPGSGF